MLRRCMERRQLSAGGIAVVGVLLAVVQIQQGIQQVAGLDGTTRLVGLLFTTGPFVIASGALAFVGYWLYTQEELESELPQVVAWGTGSVFVFASVGVLLVLNQRFVDGAVAFSNVRLVLLDMITVGALVGVLVGVYYTQVQSRQRALERERDRVEEFAEKATAINGYGRELNRCDSLMAISSLFIQATGTFLGLTQTVFLVVDEEQSEVLGNTVDRIPEADLIEIARQSEDQEPTTVVFRETLPPDVTDWTDSVLSILIAERSDYSAVLLAVPEEAVAIEEEDIELLELLTAHVATAIDGLDESPARLLQR